MDSEKIDRFFVENGKKLPSERFAVIRDKMERVDNSRETMIQSVEMKDPMLITIMSVLFGFFGVDRFMIGQIGMGLFKLLTGGGFCVLLWIDMFTIGKKVKQKNFNELMMVL